MSKSQPILQKHYATTLQELTQQDNAKLEQKRKKIAILREEQVSIGRGDWQAIIDKKQNQLVLIEGRLKEFTKKGLIKKEKAFRRFSQAQVNPQVDQVIKRRRCISKDLEEICHTDENIQKANRKQYEERLALRISKCKKKIKFLKNGGKVIDFQLEAVPLLKNFDQTSATALRLLPSSLDSGSLISNPAVFHILDNCRIRLHEPEPVLAEAPKPSAPASSRIFTFCKQRKEAPSTQPELNAVVAYHVKQLTRLASDKDIEPASRAPDWCEKCQIDNSEWYEKEGNRICKRCGFAELYNCHGPDSFYGIDYDYAEPFHYEQRNHFIDCLRQRQGKEEWDAHPKVIQSVRAEIFRRQIHDPRFLRPRHIHYILKSIGLNNCYDHEIQVWQIVTGSTPPRFTLKQEAILIRMFDQSLKPYEKYKGERKNYLTYAFAIHKMIEVRGWPRSIREFYPVLRSDSKREAQEKIFHKICGDLDWPIIATEQQFIDEAKATY